jgi:hypothetical protein
LTHSFHLKFEICKLSGNLTFWISQDLIDNWRKEELTGERGSSPKYADETIQAMARVKEQSP